MLGWISLAGFVLGLVLVFWTDALHLDFSFIIWLWLGRELKQGNPAARKWAMGISAVVTVFIVAMFVTGAGEANFGSLQFKAPDIRYYLMGASLFFLLGLPGLSLLARSAKEEFKRKQYK